MKSVKVDHLQFLINIIRWSTYKGVCLLISVKNDLLASLAKCLAYADHLTTVVNLTDFTVFYFSFRISNQLPFWRKLCHNFPQQILPYSRNLLTYISGSAFSQLRCSDRECYSRFRWESIS